MMRKAYIAAMALWIGVIGGCSQTLKPIFEEHHPAMVWPPALGQAKIRYVGQLRCAADLKPPPQLFRPLSDLVLGPSPSKPLYGPRSLICTDHGSRVWIADPGGRCVHLFDLQRRTYAKIGRIGDAHLLSPVGLCSGPGDSIFVCDSESVAIYRLASSGAPLEPMRLPEDVKRPVAMSYHEPTGELFVLDVGEHNIKVLGMDGHLHRILGRRGHARGEFNFPCALADDGNMIWVVDTGNNRVQALTHAGDFVASFGQAGDASGDLALPKGIAFDSDGHVYVVDARFENVQIFDRSGQLLLALGEEGTGPGQFWLPAGIFIDPNDRIWVCDSYNGRVQVFDYLKDRSEPRSAEEKGTVPISRLSLPTSGPCERGAAHIPGEMGTVPMLPTQPAKVLP